MIVVTNLNPETRDNAIEFFFSNKRRSSGGPVVQVDRLNKSCAHVHFSSSLGMYLAHRRINYLIRNTVHQACGWLSRSVSAN